jgi:hypothetical protein
VGELRDRLRLPIETLTELVVVREVARQDLQRDDAVEAGVSGSIDLAHAARAEGFEDFVGPETRPR